MCSSGGDRLRSAVTRASLEPPIGAADHGRTRRRMLRARHLGGGRLPVGLRAGAVLRGMVTNTLPSLWPSDTHMSGAYSTERISTSKYSGSSAATAAPTKAPFGATIARPKTIV